MPVGTASLESALAIMSCAFGLDGISSMHQAARRAVELDPAATWHRTIAVGCSAWR
jgi:hypothetical protein